MMTRIEMQQRMNEAEARTVELEVMEKIRGSISYRRVPVAFNSPGWSGGLGDGEAVKHCEHKDGHTLYVTPHGIKCRNCPAEWKDYGF